MHAGSRTRADGGREVAGARALEALTLVSFIVYVALGNAVSGFISETWRLVLKYMF